jgi:hypothetical protein
MRWNMLIGFRAAVRSVLTVSIGATTFAPFSTEARAEDASDPMSASGPML